MPDMAYPRVAARIFGRPLAIDPPRFKAILDGLGDRIVLGAFDHDGQDLPSRAEISRKRMSMVARGTVVRVEDGAGEYCLTDGGVAVIPVMGPLSQRFDWLAAVCGFATYEGIAATLEAALDSPSVKAVLFDFDSPGGECMGMIDLADKILAARGRKPMWSIANGLAASAAYALAGSADKLVVPRMGYVGSIGVVAVHVDRSEEDKKAGLKYTAIYSGARKVDGWSHAPLAKDARERMQSDIDGARQLFADLVGRQGRVSAADALATEADVFRDQDAVASGLADDVMNFEQALSALHGQVRTSYHQAEASRLAAETAARDAEAEAKRCIDIAELCQLAGRADLADGYIKSKASATEVTAELAKLPEPWDVVMKAINEESRSPVKSYDPRRRH